MVEPWRALIIPGLFVLTVVSFSCDKHSVPNHSMSSNIGKYSAKICVHRKEMSSSEFCKDTKGKVIGKLESKTNVRLILETSGNASLNESLSTISLANIHRWEEGWDIDVPNLKEILQLGFFYKVSIKGSSTNDLIRVYYNENGKRITPPSYVIGGEATTSLIHADNFSGIWKTNNQEFQDTWAIYEVVYFGGEFLNEQELSKALYYYVMPVVYLNHF